MRKRNLKRIGLAAALLLPLVPAVAAAQTTLTDALITAYQTSPLLDANRAALRALDEQVPQLRAERRPQISATGSAGASRDASSSDITDVYSAGLNASLLLVDNGQTAAAIEAARNRIAAARADLLETEQFVLLSTVEAYVDVRLALALVALARNDVEVLQEQLRAARDRFEVGEITRTDVSQTEARLANSQSLLTDALGALEISRAAYRAAVGVPPDDLQPPPSLPELPDTITNATAIGLRNNPQIVSAQYLERAAVYDVDRARAANGLSIQAQGEVRWEDRSSASPGIVNDDLVGEVGLGASIPLYTGGRNASLVREALSVLERRQFELQDAGRSVTQSIAGAWTQLEVARALIVARQEQVVASRIAAEGVSEEARLGARSQLDVLDADLERLQAEAEVVRATRDEYVAGYNLLSAMGLLTVEHLGLGIETYDPEVNFARVRPAPVGGTRSDLLDRIRARWE
jgi:outer membrane protein